MWVRTQGRRELVNGIKFSSSKSIGDKRCLIFGHFAGNAFFAENSIMLDEYSSLEKNQGELDRIQQHITEGSLATCKTSAKE